MQLKANPTGIKKGRGRSKCTNSMRIYVKKLAKRNVDAKLQLSSAGVDKLELMCDHLIERITRKAGQVMEMRKSRTLNASCVQGAISLEMHPSLAKRCDKAGVAAVLKASPPTK